MATCKGIDISVINGTVDWNKVKAAGIDFAMIKATQGWGVGASTKNLRLFTDSKFKTNIVNAHNAGLKCGVYHYMTATTLKEAKEEAEYFLSVIAPYKSYIDTWVAVDVEDVSPARYCGKLSKIELSNVTLRFLNLIKRAGYKPMLYTNPNYLKYKFNSIDSFKNYDIWLAHYNVSTPMSVNNLKVWQYSDKGRVNGVSGNVDMNVGYFTVATDYASMVCSICGFQNNTKEYFNKYTFADELWKKIYNALKK